MKLKVLKPCALMTRGNVFIILVLLLHTLEFSLSAWISGSSSQENFKGIGEERQREPRVRGGGGMSSPYPPLNDCNCKNYAPRQLPRYPRIIQGSLTTSLEEFPWSAVILQWNYLGTKSWDYVCGVSPNYFIFEKIPY